MFLYQVFCCLLVAVSATPACKLLQTVAAHRKLALLFQPVSNLLRTGCREKYLRLLSGNPLLDSLSVGAALLAMPASSASQLRKRTKSDLAHLRSLPGIEPATNTGQVAWIWPEIEAGLATGKKLREIWDAARDDGLDIPYPQFRVYVSRLRSRQSRQRRSELEATPRAAADSSVAPCLSLLNRAIPFAIFASSERKSNRANFTRIRSQFKSG